MAIETSVNIDVNVDGTATVKQAAQGFEDLGDAVAKTQREVEALALQYGINDQRTQEAIKRAGQYKGQLEQLDQAIDANKGGVDQLFRGVQGLAAGFEIAAGSLAIFGSESQELEKILIKVQGAMVLAQGLKDFKEFGGAIRGLVTLVGERLVAAFATLRTALISSGIGAAVVGVGLLVANFLRLRQETAKAAEEQKKYNDELTNLRKEREQLQKGDEQYTRDELKRVSERLAAGQRELKEKVEARNKYINDLRVLGVEEADSDRKRAENNLKEIALNNERLLNERLKLQKTVQEYDDQAAARAKSQRDVNTKTEKEEIDTFALYIQREKEKRERELRTFSSKQVLETKNYTKEQLEQVTLDLTAFQNQQTQRTLELSERIQLESTKALRFLRNNGRELLDTFVNVFGAIAALQTAFAGEDEARQKKAFETRKKLSLVQATISTIEATIAAFKSAQESPITAVLPAYPFIQAAAAAAYGLAQIQQIRNQTFSGGQVPAPSPNQGANVPSVQVRSSSLPQTQDILATNRRVYVLEGDITRTQQRVASNQSVSVLGG
jgi:hypothetical protein